MTSFHRRRALQATGLLTAVLIGSTACGGEGAGDNSKGESKPPATLKPSKTKGSEDPEKADKNAALKAYSSFWTEQVKAYQQGSLKKTQLLKYTSDASPAYQQLKGDVKQMKAAGTRKKGSPAHDAEVTKLSPKGEGKGKLPVAEIRDCLDISGWKTVKGDKVQPMPSNQPMHVTTTAKVEDWGDEGWQVLEVTPSKNEC